MFLRFFCAVVCLIMLSACSPDYNWRQVQVADGRVTALFPSKPQTQQKKLDFGGRELLFSLTGATVDDTVFAMGYTIHSGDFKTDAALRDQLYRQVVSSFYHNAGQTPPESLPGSGQWFSVRVAGSGNAKPVVLQAVVWNESDALIEALVSGPESSFPQDQAAEFFKGTGLPVQFPTQVSKGPDDLR